MATLFLVSTPIGNLSDVTARAVEVLGAVDRILAEDTRRTRILLDHLQLDTPLVSMHRHNEAARAREAAAWLRAGEDLALVSDAGTPGIADPGERLVRVALEEGHRVTPIPGVSAVLAALVASGLPTEPFVFVGFVPRKGKEREAVMDRVVRAGETAVLFESPERLVELLDALREAARPGRRVAVGREITKVHEEFFRGTLAEASRYYRKSPPRGEVTVVVEPDPSSEGPDQVDEAAARALAGALLDEGMRASEAAREVARRLDIPRNLAYEIVHSLPE